MPWGRLRWSGKTLAFRGWKEGCLRQWSFCSVNEKNRFWICLHCRGRGGIWDNESCKKHQIDDSVSASDLNGCCADCLHNGKLIISNYTEASGLIYSPGEIYLIVECTYSWTARNLKSFCSLQITGQNLKRHKKKKKAGETFLRTGN